MFPKSATLESAGMLIVMIVIGGNTGEGGTDSIFRTFHWYLKSAMSIVLVAVTHIYLEQDKYLANEHEILKL